MENSTRRTRHWAVGLVAAATIAVAAVFVLTTGQSSQSTGVAATAPKAVPVSVAVIEPRHVQLWDEFSGRLEAVDRVQIRSRVAGAIEAVHFREGARVAKGDLLISIDPAPYAAEVARAQAQVSGAQARLALANNDLERGRKLWDSRTLSRKDLDQRVNAAREAEANLQAAEAALQSAKLNLDYTKIRAPVAGRVGRLDVTVGNLVAAGPSSPALTMLVSVDPIYATFDADEGAVQRALGSLPSNAARAHLDRVPVEMLTGEGTPRRGHLQLIDNQVAAGTGTVRLRAVFANTDGSLMPGQFARLRLGRAEPKPVLMVSERAVGTDQDKRYVLVVGTNDKVAYREVTLGVAVDRQRVVTHGLKSGDRVVVDGLQRVRPGALVKPQMVSMSAADGARVADGR
jgi:multidrug efflux system membrane fusion protein